MNTRKGSGWVCGKSQWYDMGKNNFRGDSGECELISVTTVKVLGHFLLI